MPGLVRGMARTAAVVGTASATRNAVNRRQASKYAQEDQNQAQQAPAQAAATDPTVEIKKYKDLLDSGAITQDEFDAKKKELLGL